MNRSIKIGIIMIAIATTLGVLLMPQTVTCTVEYQTTCYDSYLDAPIPFTCTQTASGKTSIWDTVFGGACSGPFGYSLPIKGIFQ